MITLDGLQLPDELIWIDEFEFNKVRAHEKITLSGMRTLFQDTLISYAGRPITLSSQNSWIDKQDIQTIYSWAEELDKQMVLVLHDTRSFNVRFRYIDLPVFETELVLETAFHENETKYNITIKLEEL